jgi:predicted ATPase
VDVEAQADTLISVDRADRFVVISGCSGGGKSTLLAELAARGYAVVDEPGRRIVQEELARNGAALPWVDMAAFARRVIEVSLADRAAAAAANRLHERPPHEWVFFDRGLIDAASALHHITGEPALERVGRAHRYHRRVFLTPPWPDIYATDAERRHDLDAAIAEYDRLTQAYPSLGYEVIVLPKIGVAERADFILRTLGSS